MKNLVFPVCLLSLVALTIYLCGRMSSYDEHKVPVLNTVSPNGYKISLLFEHDGCKVYRFYDEGWDRYFVKCKFDASTKVVRSYQSGRMQKHMSEDIYTK